MFKDRKNINYRIYKKVIFITFILLIYRIGSYIPLFGIDLITLNEISNSKKSALDVFNMLTGGAASRISIFSLNIIPYITASIILELSSIVFKELGNLKKTGEYGRFKIKQYSKYLSILIATFQGLGIAYNLETWNFNGIPLIKEQGIHFRVNTVITLTAGTIITIWLSEQINKKKIGAGSSIIIFSGIVSGLIPTFILFLEMNKKVNYFFLKRIIVSLIVILLTIILIVFFENSYRKIKICYLHKRRNFKTYLNENTYLPIKINISGIMPPIFSNTILASIIAICDFTSNDYTFLFKIKTHLAQDGFLFILTNVILIVFFCSFYVNVVLDTKEISKNLYRSGAIIIPVIPGKKTSSFIKKILNKIVFISSLYIIIICVVIDFLFLNLLKLNLTGTNLLIIVSVILEINNKLKFYLLPKKYLLLYKKVNIVRKLKKYNSCL